MENWINNTKKMAESDTAAFIFPRNVTGYAKTEKGIILEVSCNSFGTKIQKSFGYTFPRFIDKGNAGQYSISIEAVGSFAFRIRYSASGELRNKTLMAPDVPKAADFIISESEDCLFFSMENAELEIEKRPLHIRLNQSNGTTLLEIPGIDTAHPNASGAGGFASLKDFYPFGLGEGLTTFTSKMKLNEKIYGLGEKFVGIDRRGQHLESIQQDCAGNEGARTYKNIPFYMSTAGYGVFVNSAYLMDFDIGANNFDYANIFLEDELMDIFLIAGPSLKDILYRYCLITGFAPELPRWSYGLWMSRNSYENEGVVRGVAADLRLNDIPCDVLHLDTYWFEKDWVCDLEFSKERFPKPKKLMADLSKMGFTTSVWQLPYVHESLPNFKEGVDNGYFVNTGSGETYMFDWFGEQYGLIDFSNDDAVAWYLEKIKNVLRMGAKVVKTDIAEGMPVDGVYKNISGKEMHNLFPLIYNKVMYGAAEEIHGKGIVWARSSYAGGQRYPVPWSGDSRSTFENLAGALRAGLSIGLSGHPYWSHDIGGFIGIPDAELYVRWAQLGLFSSHSRCHGGGNNNPREPWAFGVEALEIFRKYAKLRYRLLPYIYSTEACSVATGLPFMRHMALMHQEDRNTYGIYDQYYFGDSIMIAPLLNRGGKRQVYLPKGIWFDYHTGEKVSCTGWVDVEADIGTLPMYIPAGSVIVYGPEISHTSEKVENQLDIHVYSEGERLFRYKNGSDDFNFVVKYENGRCSFDDGGCTVPYKLTIIGE
jgi:alpha-D-xyloside xylohydrolase